jgi:hypothetical protein
MDGMIHAAFEHLAALDKGNLIPISLEPPRQRKVIHHLCSYGAMSSDRTITCGASQEILAIHGDGLGVATPHRPEIHTNRGQEVNDEGNEQGFTPGICVLERSDTQEVDIERKRRGDPAGEALWRMLGIGVCKEEPFACAPLSKTATGVALAIPPAWRRLMAVNDPEARRSASKCIKLRASVISRRIIHDDDVEVWVVLAKK